MDDDANWLRERAEDLVRYEEDAQRLRRIANRLDADKIADCLERVAEEHSGCFTEEDAVVVASAICTLRAGAVQ